jgi:hypothetical protein
MSGDTAAKAATLDSREILFGELGLGDDECKKYAPLLKYFINLDANDMQKFSQDDLEYAALPEHKLLMLMFAQRLKQIFDERKQFANCSVLTVNAISWKFSSIAESSNKISTKDLVTKLPHLAKERSKFDVIDVSGKNLLDDDLPFISEAFSAFDVTAQILDLHDNRFGAHGPFSEIALASCAAVKKLIESAKFQYVDISGCGLTSFSHREFISSMCTEERRDHFIWIPRFSLQRKMWVSCVLDEQKEDVALIDKILNVHDAYYKLRDALML